MNRLSAVAILCFLSMTVCSASFAATNDRSLREQTTFQSETSSDESGEETEDDAEYVDEDPEC